MDYENIETDVLLTQVKEIAKVLKSRLEEGESEAKKKSSEKIDERLSVMDVDNMKRRYVLTVSTDDIAFDVEWHNQNGEFGNGMGGTTEEQAFQRKSS